MSQYCKLATAQGTSLKCNGKIQLFFQLTKTTEKTHWTERFKPLIHITDIKHNITTFYWTNSNN